MRWTMTRTIDGVKQWWQEAPESEARENLGIAGKFVYTLSEATKVHERERDRNPTLGAGLTWEVYANRHADALQIDGACNPAGVALSLHEAFREVIREGGDTNAQQTDPACRLIMAHLAYLLQMPRGYQTADYIAYMDACEQHVKNQKIGTVK